MVSHDDFPLAPGSPAPGPAPPTTVDDWLTGRATPRPPSPVPEAPVTPAFGPEPPPIGDADLAPVVSIVRARRGGAALAAAPSEFGTHVIHSHSLESAVRIIEDNERGVRPTRLAFDEMTSQIMFGDRPLIDSDVASVRLKIEREYQGARSKGLKFSTQDVREALEHVALEHPFHPVRDYVRSLRWDGVERLNHVVEELLSATATALRVTMLRAWFIGCVARALSPGCKMDTVLILVGRQGAKKSTFFSTLAGPWFGDTPVDIKSKQAFMVLRQSWIYEMAELESLRRASDADQIKSFATSQTDNYTEPYAHYATKVPRAYVIVGTTNRREFLSDDTGNRRIHPLEVGDIDIKATIGQRDQLWAEACTAYQMGESWWLGEDFDRQLTAENEAFDIHDAWHDIVVEWLANPANSSDGSVSVAEILVGALKKDVSRWERSDQVRVASILRLEHWEMFRVRGSLGGNPVRRWRRERSA